METLLGPFFLGLIVNIFLWGLQEVAQSYHYYRSFRKWDRRWLRVAVTIIFIIDAIESISVSQVGWRILVRARGDKIDSLIAGWGLNMTPIMDATTASTVHFFYAYKIWTLLDAPYNSICTIIVLVLSMTQLTAGIGCTAFMFSIHMSLPEFYRVKTWGSIWLFTAAATDIVITGLMTWKLLKSRTGLKSTDDIISKLVRLTVETGLATAGVQLVDIIVFLLAPLKPYHVVPAFIGPKVYSNSMLALLNSRRPRSEMTWDSNGLGPTGSVHVHTAQLFGPTDNYELDQITTKKTTVE